MYQSATDVGTCGAAFAQLAICLITSPDVDTCWAAFAEFAICPIPRPSVHNAVVDVPPALAEALKDLIEIDIRCNPLSAESSRAHRCTAVFANKFRQNPNGYNSGVRVKFYYLYSKYQGLLLGDPSIAWDLRTLRAVGVTHVLQLQLSSIPN
ncbi:hypothetical protein T492DRAFT_1152450 [Pavlovales sp. CCMP2436]|nr:hypothetical protein T492DRAFT_1152450 [Pavlovales sp. CCMP2436]